MNWACSDGFCHGYCLLYIHIISAMSQRRSFSFIWSSHENDIFPCQAILFNYLSFCHFANAMWLCHVLNVNERQAEALNWNPCKRCSMLRGTQITFSCFLWSHMTNLWVFKILRSNNKFEYASFSLSLSLSRASILKCFIAPLVWQVTAKLLKLSLCDFRFSTAQNFLTGKPCFKFMAL